jgi:hypothetical protein
MTTLDRIYELTKRLERAERAQQAAVADLGRHVLEMHRALAGLKRALKCANALLAKNPDGNVTHRIVAVPFTNEEMIAAEKDSVGDESETIA